MDIIDTSTLTPQDKALLMCIERIDNLEEQLYHMQKELLVRDILTLDTSGVIAINVFMYLLGAPSAERSPLDIERDVDKYYNQNHQAQIRVQELAALMKTEKPLWEMTASDISIIVHYDDGSFGSHLPTVLEAMTLDELKGYWQYHLNKEHCPL